MAEIRIKDEGGDAMTLIDFGDFRSSFYGKSLTEITEIQRQLPTLTFQNGDILIASYQKTGCTWTHELVSMILAGQSEEEVPNKMKSMLEATRLEDLDSIPAPRLLNTHIPYHRLPADFHKKRVRTIFVVRNPKDTAVSLYHHMTGMTHYHYEGTFSNWLPLFLRGELTSVPYCKYLPGWEEAMRDNPDHFLLISYEGLKRDTVGEIKRIAQFIDVELTEDTTSAISAKCQFKEMKNRCEHGTYGHVKFKDGAPGFFRKGYVGDWKNWFTVAQSEMFDRMFSEGMNDSQLNFVYTLH